VKFNLMASMSQTSYGLVSQYLLKEFQELEGIEIAIFPKGQQSSLPFFPGAPSLQIWHQFDLAYHVGKGHVAYSFYEMNGLTELEQIHMKSVDCMCVPSKWAQEVANKHNIITKGIPLGVDTEIFQPKEKPESPTYTFLNIGKWELRKGHDIIPELFQQAFPNNENVKLLMMPNNPFLNEGESLTWINHYREVLGNRVAFLNPMQHHAQIAQVIQSADCGLFPSRAEGWNMPLLECMACGLPVITTKYSAHTEYCTDNNSFTVTPRGLEKAYDGKWFHGDFEWADLDKDCKDGMIEHMRFCYEERPSNPAGVSTAKTLTWKKCAESLLLELNMLNMKNIQM